MAEFTETFNVEEGMGESYRRFIERLRNSVAVRYSHSHAVTPYEVNPPTRFFDIVFQTRTHNITIRFRRDNLYLVAYRMEGSNQWLELRYDNNPRHRIPGSTFLSFGDRYADLTDAAGASLTGIDVGREELIDAVNNLATSTDDAVRAESIIVILLMIVESLRFNAITDHFTTHRNSELTPSWIENFLHGWRTLSNSLLHVDANPRINFPYNNRFQVSTVDAALGVIGILKGHFFGPGPRPGGVQRRMDDGEEYCEGRPLVEIYSVTVNNIAGDSETRGDVYGTIEVSDGLSISQYIYNHGSNDSESIHTRENILLNGPARCITADDDFIFKVALKSKEWLSEDDELSKGEIFWEVMNITANEYDQPIRRQVNGQNGASATVNYAVLSEAVQARIVVTLIDSDGGEAIDIYGQIAAQNDKIGEKSVLFGKADNKYINVKPGGMIPLSRSVVAVPTNSTLIVSADLTRSIFGPDDKIANGQATFSARLSGTYEQYISTVSPTNYRIKVTVTWDWYVY